jgi:hypothetical protein
MSFLYRINQESVANSIPSKEGELLEREIEELLQKNNELVLGEKILYIGRQIKTSTGKILDLLAIDQLGRLIVIELKRGYAPRDIVAQVIDYSSWLSKLSEREIENLAKNYFDKNNAPYRKLDDAFTSYFGHEPEIRLGEEIVNVLFAQEFPPDLINQMEYLRKQGLGIKCIRFDLFGINAEEKFLLVHKMFEDKEERKSSTEPISRVPTTQNQNYRPLLAQVTKVLGEKYNDWASALGDGLWHPFKTWRARDRSETWSYIDWNFDGGKLGLGCGIVAEESSENDSLFVSLWIRKESNLLSKNFRHSSIRTILVKQFGYYDGLEDDDDTYYQKECKIDMLNVDTISKIAIEEIEKIKPLIEKILTK